MSLNVSFAFIPAKITKYLNTDWNFVLFNAKNNVLLLLKINLYLRDIQKCFLVIIILTLIQKLCKWNIKSECEFVWLHSKSNVLHGTLSES